MSAVESLFFGLVGLALGLGVQVVADEILEDAGVPAASATPPPYERSAFGRAWLDADGNGCDQRNDVLARDLRSAIIRADCVVESGTLHDPYTGLTEEFVRGTYTSRLVQVDHVYPLKAAWDGGAWAWEPSRRAGFANDLENLVAVSDNVNASKGAEVPPTWTPPLDSADCAYALHFTAVAARYSLPVSDDIETVCPLTGR